MKINKKLAKSFYLEVIKNSIWLTIILLLIDTHVFFFVKNEYLKDLFNFASEKTPATWISSTLFLIIGFSLFGLQMIKNQGEGSEFRRKRGQPGLLLNQRGYPIQKKWQYFGYFFLYLSLDDASYMHEQISSWINSKSQFIQNLPSYGWLYTIAPIILLILLTFFYYLYKELKKQKLSRKYLILAIFLLVIAITLDFTDGLYSDTHLNYIATHYFRVAEEFIEIIAFALILKSVSNLVLYEK